MCIAWIGLPPFLGICSYTVFLTPLDHKIYANPTHQSLCLFKNINPIYNFEDNQALEKTEKKWGYIWLYLLLVLRLFASIPCPGLPARILLRFTSAKGNYFKTRPAFPLSTQALPVMASLTSVMGRGSFCAMSPPTGSVWWMHCFEKWHNLYFPYNRHKK